jgi:hypothetical protein
MGNSLGSKTMKNDPEFNTFILARRGETKSASIGDCESRISDWKNFMIAQKNSLSYLTAACM